MPYYNIKVYTCVHSRIIAIGEKDEGTEECENVRQYKEIKAKGKLKQKGILLVPKQ